MEDDEEFSYTGYSAQTEAELNKNRAAFIEDEEVYSYSGYSDEVALTEGAALPVYEKENTSSYGDYLIEEFSAETNAKRVAKFTKIPRGAAAYCVSAVYLIVGVLCVSITSLITHVLPYIVGGMMLFVGITRLIVALCRREYRSTKTNRTATSMLVAGLGAMIIVQQIDPENDPIMLISIIWGVMGLFEGAHAFNHAFAIAFKSWRCVYFFLKGIIECTVAFILLYWPLNHDVHYLHIVVFGANLILDAITMLPPVKNFFKGKKDKEEK